VIKTAIKAAIAVVPLPWKLGAIALLAGGALLGFLAWKQSIYQSGYDDAIKDVAEQNAVRTEQLREAVSKVRACRDSGRVWDQSRGVCS